MGFRPIVVPTVWMRQRLVCEVPVPRNTFEAKNRCGIALSGTQIASMRLTVGVPQGSGGGQVESSCMHDGSREGLSGDHELHEQRVGFHVSEPVTLEF